MDEVSYSSMSYIIEGDNLFLYTESDFFPHFIKEDEYIPFDLDSNYIHLTSNNFSSSGSVITPDIQGIGNTQGSDNNNVSNSIKEDIFHKLRVQYQFIDDKKHRFNIYSSN